MRRAGRSSVHPNRLAKGLPARNCGNHCMLTLLLAQVNNVYHTLALNTLAWGTTSCLSDQISRQYNLFQNGCHATILLFLFKLAFVASFVRANFKRIFHLQRGSNA